jgi:hypothetical protein
VRLCAVFDGFDSFFTQLVLSIRHYVPVGFTLKANEDAFEHTGAN